MSFLLDTDICSAYLKGDRVVWQKVHQYTGQLNLSVVSVGELFTWALRRKASPKRLSILQNFLQDVVVIDVTFQVGEQFGTLRASLIDSGQVVPEMDLFIAATALVHDLTLVTHNTQDYANIRGLRHQDWLVP